MSTEQFVLTVLNGLTFGALLFLVAAGFTLIFGLMRVLNLAHGAFYLWGGYVGYALHQVTGSFWMALLGATAVVALGGAVAERTLFRRVRGQPRAEILLAIGLSLVLADVALAVFGGDSVSIPVGPGLRGTVDVLGVSYPVARLLYLAAALAVLLGVWLLLSRTKIGAIVRAGVDDDEMLGALGVNVGLVFTAMFVFGAALAGAAGVAGGTFLGLYPGADFEILLYALVVVVVGGLGSLWGAGLGALLVGLVVSFGTALAPELLYFLMFGPMLAVLVLRPQGLLGKVTA